jgi:hypothetical protein
MKLYEIARQALATADARLAESLLCYLERKHGLNYVGAMEYFAAHDIDPREYEDLVEEA